MAPPALPNLYCSPNDIFDFLGTEGAQLALDDHNLATGQKIIVVADAAQNATSLSIASLTAPLLRGTVLEFDGAGDATVVEAVLTAVGNVGDTSLTVAAIPGPLNATSAAQDSGVNVALAQRLTKGCSYGTSQVKLYCCSRYDDSQLVRSWSVNRWATVIGSRWVRSRRGQTASKGLEDDYRDTLDELKMVRFSQLNIEDIGTRTSEWPFLSNITVDPYYTIAKARVEQPLSELTPTQYGQFVDWSSVFLIEY